MDKILPVIEDIGNGEENGEPKLDVYKILAEICAHRISDEALHLSVEPIFTKLLVRITDIYFQFCQFGRGGGGGARWT